MAWFRRKPPISDEDLLAQANPLLSPGEWEQRLGDRRRLHRQRVVSTAREYRRDWKYVLFGAILGAVVVGSVSFVTKGVLLAHRHGYDANGAIMMEAPAPSILLPILWNSAWAAFVGAFVMLFLRRVWRRR